MSPQNPSMPEFIELLLRSTWFTPKSAHLWTCLAYIKRSSRFAFVQILKLEKRDSKQFKGKYVKKNIYISTKNYGAFTSRFRLVS